MVPLALQPLQRHRQLAYLITDPYLIIREVGKDFYLAGQKRKPFVGQPLLQLLPGLVGLEPIFHTILTGKVVSHVVELATGVAVPASSEHYRLRSQAHYNSQGKVDGLIYWQEAPSGQHELHQEIQSLREQVEIFQHMLDMVAHDLSTPATLLAGYLELLTSASQFSAESDAAEYLRAMTSTVGRLMPMIDGLYDLAHAASGRLRLSRRPVNLGEFLHDLALEFRPKFASRNQQMLIEVADNLPEVPCDMVRFAQIVNNLFSNASKYSPEYSQINIRAVLIIQDSANQPEWVQISVSDLGAGIASVELDNIFKRHYRTPNAERSLIRGAGLGLYIARLLVELHGGRIWCESTPDVGSTFHFTIPIQPMVENE